MFEKTIDLWIDELSAANEQYAYFWDLLDTHERTKTLRFVHDKHRYQYAIAHAKLRLILATYLKIEPNAINFAFGDFGKPYVTIDGTAHTVKFNLSHSGNKMIVAVGYNDFIGVDIEAWDNKLDFLAIAKQCFAASETTAWLALPESEKPAMFYQLWTRKESFAKATGAGITLDVAQVTTTAETGVSHFASIPHSFGNIMEWQLVDLKFNDGISAALTVKTNDSYQINFQTLSI